LKEKPSEINGEWQNIMDDVIDHLDMEEEQLFSIIEEITDEI
jgi:hemerythrin superfamily protein